jgi:predicted helicase
VDLACPVTTDPQHITDWICHAPDARLRLILATHVSAHLVGAALNTAHKTANLLIVDEAHETAGRADKHVTSMHHDVNLPAPRRLYMTATPRILTANRRGKNSPDVAV